MGLINIGRVVGLSAYEAAKESGFTGSEAEWLESLKLHYADLTEAEIEQLQQPAAEIADIASKAEALRVSAETLREAAEDTRAGNEDARIGAEQTRATAETGRATAESNRAGAEEGRTTAETLRVTAENLRVSKEATRVAAESSRAEAEEGRTTEETSRVRSETARATAESSRVEAEQGRVESEAARETAETERVSAEAAREEAAADALQQQQEAVTEAIEAIEAPSDNKTYARRNGNWVELDSSLEEKVNQSDIVQEAGDSPQRVISQAAATELFLHKGDVDLNELLAYGVEFDTTISSPTCTRIGNRSLHRSLPIHNGMRGCLLSDDGEVLEYLPTDDWSEATLDGSAGQVMVEIPTHYRKFVTNGTVRQVWLSEHPLEGYHRVPKMYVSAYEASLQRSTSKLCSVVNPDADYRGGNNNADYDDTYRSFLGKPATSISLTNSRTYARNRKANSTEWNCMTYEAHKTIFWLFVTEYATLNSQSAINAELTTEGYKQGGLGNGVTNMSDWGGFNGNCPFIPCGYTNALGNGTGEVAYEVCNEDNSVRCTVMANRYRGIENPFGHIWQWADGILVDVRTDDYDGNFAGQSRVFVAPDPADFASHSTLADSYEGYEFRGLQTRTSSSYIKEIIFGEYGDMMSKILGGGSTTFFCDSSFAIMTTSLIRGVRFGGYASHGSGAGFVGLDSANATFVTNTSVGSRLCFHPNQI